MLDNTHIFFNFREDDIKKFLQHVKSIALDTFSHDTARSVIEKMLENYKSLCSKCSTPKQDGLRYLEAFCQYDSSNEEGERAQICKLIISESIPPTSYSYEAVFKIFNEYYIIFLALAYVFLYHDLFKARVCTKRLQFKEL